MRAWHAPMHTWHVPMHIWHVPMHACRGLRLKTGVDMGEAVGEVNALTGRICYRGKVVNRALRITQTASSNQVSGVHACCVRVVWCVCHACMHGACDVCGVCSVCHACMHGAWCL